MESHFEYALNFFPKYDRHTKTRLSSLIDSTLETSDLQTNETSFEIYNCLLPPRKQFEALVPQIILELEKNIFEKSNLVEIKK